MELGSRTQSLEDQVYVIPCSHHSEGIGGWQWRPWSELFGFHRILVRAFLWRETGTLFELLLIVRIACLVELR